MDIGNMEEQTDGTLDDVCVGKEKAEVAASESAMNSADSGEEKEGKIDEHDCTGERSNGGDMAGGYNKDRPPEDDCCPICFGEFLFPCRTSCGHWFCSGCILELWRYSTSFKPCKCPMCSCLIVKLVPESSVMNRTGEEVSKILNKIQQYNHLTGGGLMGLFLKVLALPILIRRRSQEYLNPVMLRNIYNMMRLFGILLSMLYDSYNFRFFPNGGLGIQLLFEVSGYAVVVFLIVDVIWHKWMLRRHARRLAQQPNLL